MCPGFWDWLKQQNRLGVIYSIDRCRTELTDGNDELAEWAKKQGDSFFLSSSDAGVVSNMEIVSEWVTSSGLFREHIVHNFLSKADPFLIAHSLTNDHIIITHEVYNRDKLTIPTVCRHFNVECITIFDLLKLTGAKLVLR
jgi:hypothetical protein